MQVSTYDLVIPQFINGLRSLKSILEKTQNYCTEKKVDPAVALGSRLAIDQFNFCRQVQITTDIAKGAASRLSKKENMTLEDSEKNLEELIARVEKTILFMEKFRPEDFSKAQEVVVEFPWMPGKKLAGKDFLIQHALPNFYFHLTTAYSILRHNGLQIGKGDFLGQQNWY
jgi:hypothetical protein